MHVIKINYFYSQKPVQVTSQRAKNIFSNQCKNSLQCIGVVKYKKRQHCFWSRVPLDVSWGCLMYRWINWLIGFIASQHGAAEYFWTLPTCNLMNEMNIPGEAYIRRKRQRQTKNISKPIASPVTLWLFCFKKISHDVRLHTRTSD